MRNKLLMILGLVLIAISCKKSNKKTPPETSLLNGIQLYKSQLIGIWNVTNIQEQYFRSEESYLSTGLADSIVLDSTYSTSYLDSINKYSISVSDIGNDSLMVLTISPPFNTDKIQDGQYKLVDTNYNLNRIIYYTAPYTDFKLYNSINEDSLYSIGVKNVEAFYLPHTMQIKYFTNSQTLRFIRCSWQSQQGSIFLPNVFILKYLTIVDYKKQI